MRLFLALVAAWLFATAAYAVPGDWTTYSGTVIGTPVGLGKTSVANTTSPQTVSTTTTADAPAGQTNVIIAAAIPNVSGQTVNWSLVVNNDSAGNAYTGAASKLYAWNQNTVDLPNGGSYSATWTNVIGSNALSFYQIAYSISGLVTSGGLDTTGSGTGTGTAPSATESAPAVAHRILIAITQVPQGASDTFTEDSNWTTAPGSPVTLAGKSALHVAYLIVNDLTQHSYAPTLGTSRAWTVNLISFDGAP